MGPPFPRSRDNLNPLSEITMDFANRSKGLLFALAGVMLLIPDALCIRGSGLEAWTLVFWRSLLSAPVFLALVLVLHFRTPYRQDLKIGWAGGLLSLAITISSFLFILSMTLTSAANVLVIIALSPVFAALIDRIFHHQRLALRTWVAIVACFIGVIILVGDGLGKGNGLGDLIALVNALMLGIELSQMGSMKTERVIPAMALGYALPSLLVIPLTGSLIVPASSLPAVLFMGLVIMPFAFVLISRGSRYLPSAQIGLLTLLEAVGGPLLVWLVLGENPGINTLVGGAVIIGTLAWHSVLDLMEERRSSPYPMPGAPSPETVTETT